MYFVFESELCAWRNQIVQARLQGGVPDYQPHWWDCEPLTIPLPRLSFIINAKAPLLDNYFTGTEFDLYSARLVTFLREANVHFETFPAKVAERKTKQVLSSISYEVFHLLETHPGLDETRSDMDDEEIRKLVLTDVCIQSRKPFFRLKENVGIVLIHQTLKSILDAAEITGCKYTPVDEFRTGIRFYFEELEAKNST